MGARATTRYIHDLSIYDSLHITPTLHYGDEHESNSSQSVAAGVVILELDENDILGAVLYTKSVRFQR